MRFWDSSAIVPLIVREAGSAAAAGHARAAGLAVWWATPVECLAALARRLREGHLAAASHADAAAALERLSSSWTEIQPSRPVRQQAQRCLMLHPLRSGDALQLAAALVWAGGQPAGRGFVCEDRRLREAAAREGFRVLPAILT